MSVAVGVSLRTRDAHKNTSSWTANRPRRGRLAVQSGWVGLPPLSVGVGPAVRDAYGYSRGAPTGRAANGLSQQALTPVASPKRPLKGLHLFRNCLKGLHAFRDYLGALFGSCLLVDCVL